MRTIVATLDSTGTRQLDVITADGSVRRLHSSCVYDSQQHPDDPQEPRVVCVVWNL